MTTLDAPFWLQLAMAYNEWVYQQKNGLWRYSKSIVTYLENSVNEKNRPPC